MQIKDEFHGLEISFQIPIAPDKSIGRSVYVFLILGDQITLIDSGVKGAEDVIFQYVKNNGRSPQDIYRLLLSHAHPDHIGSAKTIADITGCEVFAHSREKAWIEDIEQQFRSRPIPGFHGLVGGSVVVNHYLNDGQVLEFQKGMTCKVLHTPGHSSGSVSFLFENENMLFTGDALPLPGDLPIYEDILTSIKSIRRILGLQNVDTILSSWEPPIKGRQVITQRIKDAVSYLKLIHDSVLKAYEKTQDMTQLCQYVVRELGLPPFAANPIVAKAFASHIEARHRYRLFDI